MFPEDPQEALRPDLQGARDFYGSAPQSKGNFKRLPRRQINVFPILINLFVPWLQFSGLFAVLAFSIHYTNPSITSLVIVLSTVVVVLSLANAAKTRWRKYFVRMQGNVETPGEPTWALAFAIFMLIAWVAALILGSLEYKRYTSLYYDVMSFNSYDNVYPAGMRGEQLMDAGAVTFVQNTTLDVTKAAGFKDGTTYCVAPIVHQSTPMEVYDFWAVGTDCCSPTSADFRCYRNLHAGGGIRQMDASARAFYRLAVQEAEAMYHIKANHPVFFTWEADPHGVLDGWQRHVVQTYVRGALAHLIFQAFCVTSLTLGFSRLGQF